MILDSRVYCKVLVFFRETLIMRTIDHQKTGKTMKKIPKKTVAVKAKVATKKSLASKSVSSKKKFSLSKIQKRVIAVVVVIVLGLGTYLGVQYYQDATADAKSCVNRVYILNARSMCVKYAQSIMGIKKPDAVFGPNTRKALSTKYKTTVLNKAAWKKLCQRGWSKSKSADRQNAGCKVDTWKRQVRRQLYITKQGVTNYSYETVIEYRYYL